MKIHLRSVNAIFRAYPSTKQVELAVRLAVSVITRSDVASPARKMGKMGNLQVFHALTLDLDFDILWDYKKEDVFVSPAERRMS